MEDLLYKKGTDAALDADFSAAAPFAKIKLGKQNVFYKKGIRWHLVPLSEVERAYHRIEEAKSHTGCCSTDFSLHKLMLVLKDGTTVAAVIGDSLYRHEDAALMEAFIHQNPQIRISATEE